MTVFKHPRGKTWRYDFWWTPPGAPKPVRYTGTTGQLTKEDAELVEADIKKRVRQEAFGIAPLDRMRTPSFTMWAQEHYRYVKKRDRVGRLDVLESNLRLVLQFWGRRPKKMPVDLETVDQRARRAIEKQQRRAATAPYHNLRLLDPIIDPNWIEKFEDWMTSLGLSGSRKNHYRSAMSGLYRTALLPAFRKRTNVPSNPFLHIERDRVPSRDVVLSLEQLRAWMRAAAPHARLAMAIAAYAPELRESSILSLTWKDHLDTELTRIVVPQHKTARRTGRPQVVPVSVDLHEILTWAREQRPGGACVVSYRGEQVGSLKVGLRNAVTRANKTLPRDQRLVYGAKGGVTFHTIRHTIATLLAGWGMPEKIRQMVMGHESLSTTQKYTHMAAVAKKAPLGRLGRRLQLPVRVVGGVQEARSKTSK